MPPALLTYESITEPISTEQQRSGDFEYKISDIQASRKEVSPSNEELRKTWKILFQETSEEMNQQVFLVKKFLRDIAVEADDDSVLIAGLRGIVQKNPNILLDLAENDQELLSDRALAARLAVALGGSEVDRQRVKFLAGHRSPMIRAGVMYGFGDLNDIGKVRVFLDDPHATVRAEAQDVLDDLNE